VEARLLRALWALGQATVEQVVSYFPLNERPNYKTTHTMLRILESKGFLTHTVVGKAFVFRPLISQEEVTRASVDLLLNQSFGGSTRGLMINLIEGGRLKNSDLRDLEDLINQHKQLRKKGESV
jgi:predicted transcriptional regulator